MLVMVGNEKDNVIICGFKMDTDIFFSFGEKV